eukprot:2904840-Prymnesium_polylepis.2
MCIRDRLRRVREVHRRRGAARQHEVLQDHNLHGRRRHLHGHRHHGRAGHLIRAGVALLVSSRTVDWVVCRTVRSR